MAGENMTPCSGVNWSFPLQRSGEKLITPCMRSPLVVHTLPPASCQLVSCYASGVTSVTMTVPAVPWLHHRLCLRMGGSICSAASPQTGLHLGPAPDHSGFASPGTVGDAGSSPTASSGRFVLHSYRVVRVITGLPNVTMPASSRGRTQDCHAYEI